MLIKDCLMLMKSEGNLWLLKLQVPYDNPQKEKAKRIGLSHKDRTQSKLMTHKGQPQHKVTYLALYTHLNANGIHRTTAIILTKQSQDLSPTEGSWQLQSTMIGGFHSHVPCERIQQHILTWRNL